MSETLVFRSDEVPDDVLILSRDSSFIEAIAETDPNEVFEMPPWITSSNLAASYSDGGIAIVDYARILEIADALRNNKTNRQRVIEAKERLRERISPIADAYRVSETVAMQAAIQYTSDSSSSIDFDLSGFEEVA